MKATRIKTGKTARQLLLLVALSVQVSTVVAADSPVSAGETKIDTSQWKCKFCPYEEGVKGEMDLGIGNVSHDSFKFGEYTGLNEDGAFFVGNANLRYRNEDATYFDLTVSDLGLDSRSLGVEGGKQGKYKLVLEYDELPHYISDTAKTPFIGTGSNSLTLPPGWVPAGSTGGMTALGASLKKVDIETERKRIGVGATFIPGSNWEYGLKYRHETKEGTKRIAGTFFFSSAQLIQPVDYVTDEVDVSASYTGHNWQARLAYFGSVFRNSNEFLTWQNPYTPFVVGADTGQLALPPDNQFHQIVLSGGYQFSDKTRAMADLAVGRMEQNENFLSPTLNTNIIVPPLSRPSLDGQVDTTTANVKVVSALTDKLRLNASYMYNDRDNKTPQSTYNWVTTDAFVAVPRTNQPYSFTQNTLKLGADYRIDKHLKLAFGLDHDAHERTFLDVDKTDENTFWGKVIVRAKNNADLTLKFAHAQRDRSAYEPVPEIDPPQNPLLRKYYMADRTRDTAGAHASVAPRERVNLGFGIDFSRDNYSDSTIGLTGSREVDVSADASVILTDKTSMHFFINHELIKSNQAGSQTFSTADWFSDNTDTINTFGVGVKHKLLKDKLDIGANYTVSQSRGEIAVNSGAPDPPFPDLITKLSILKLYSTYRLKGGLSLQGAYWYETYDSTNWMLDGVTPSTVPNVLSLGEITPSYNVSVVTLSVRYKF